MERHVISARKQGLHVLHLFDRAWQAPGGFYRNGRVVADDLHSQIKSESCDEASDGTQAQNTEGFTLKFGSSKLLLVGFKQRPHIIFRQAGVEIVYKLHTAHDVTRREQHPGGHKFLNRVCICSRSVEHNDATFSTVVHGNVVDAGSRSSDSGDAVPDIDIREFVTSE